MRLLKVIACLCAVMLAVAACAAPIPSSTPSATPVSASPSPTQTAVRTPPPSPTACPTQTVLPTPQPTEAPETVLQEGGFIPPPEIAREGGDPAPLSEADKFFSFGGCAFYLGMTEEEVIRRAEIYGMTQEEFPHYDPKVTAYALKRGDHHIELYYDAKGILVQVGIHGMTVGAFETARGYKPFDTTLECFYALYGGPDEHELTTYRGTQIKLRYKGDTFTYEIYCETSDAVWYDLYMYLDGSVMERDGMPAANLDRDVRYGTLYKVDDIVPPYGATLFEDEEELRYSADFLREHHPEYELTRETGRRWKITYMSETICEIILDRHGVIEELRAITGPVSTGRGVYIGDTADRLFLHYGKNYRIQEDDGSGTLRYVYSVQFSKLEVCVADGIVTSFSVARK